MISDENYELVNSLDISFPEKFALQPHLNTSIKALDHVTISFSTKSLLSLIFNVKAMEEYNKCFKFLIKIQRVIYILSKKDFWKHRHQDLYFKRKRNREEETPEQRESLDILEHNSKQYNKYQHQFLIFQRELFHFAKNLETFIKARVLQH